MILSTKFLLYTSLFVMLIACANNTNEKGAAMNGNTTMVSFFIISKDSASIDNYSLERKVMSDGIVAFTYLSKFDTFSVFFDTSGNRVKAKFGKDIAELELDQTRHYTINGKDFKVFKLTADKDVTDGSFSLFINAEFGLLLNKSNTWRMAKVIIPVKNNIYYPPIAALLYRLQTDEKFFSDSIPDIKKFTTPKFE